MVGKADTTGSARRGTCEDWVGFKLGVICGTTGAGCGSGTEVGVGAGSGTEVGVGTGAITGGGNGIGVGIGIGTTLTTGGFVGVGASGITGLSGAGVATFFFRWGRCRLVPLKLLRQDFRWIIYAPFH